MIDKVLGPLCLTEHVLRKSEGFFLPKILFLICEAQLSSFILKIGFWRKIVFLGLLNFSEEKNLNKKNAVWGKNKENKNSKDGNSIEMKSFRRESVLKSLPKVRGNFPSPPLVSN